MVSNLFVNGYKYPLTKVVNFTFSSNLLVHYTTYDITRRSKRKTLSQRRDRRPLRLLSFRSRQSEKSLTDSTSGGVGSSTGKSAGGCVFLTRDIPLFPGRRVGFSSVTVSSKIVDFEADPSRRWQWSNWKERWVRTKEGKGKGPQLGFSEGIIYNTFYLRRSF